ncbi:hypothetical protein CDL12_22927 [Handroanthus impetiginosus]|uniref:Uncharacterized protein n=1 Tax=Handroanthus impetiginosus TaxID=429701 RepID=A0A2G9GGY1_9LAMI|nr:hypothetical protein CDL12_22927 [Handroanthus impetiginosus]
MNSIIRSLSRNNLSSSSLMADRNREIIISENMNQQLQNWKSPETSASQIYKSKVFDFSSYYIVKIVEESIPLQKGYENFIMLSKKLIEQRRHKYKYLLLGTIQVGLKPLTRLGLNTSALIIVRDRRHNQFKDSLLGIVESTLRDGPSLILNIKTEGFDMLKDTPNVALVYRMCYKVMNIVVPNIRNNPEFVHDKKGKTTLFITDLEKSNILVPKTIAWNQVKLPEAYYELKKDFPNFNNSSQIVVIESTYQTYIIAKGKLVQTMHPPCTLLRMKTAKDRVIDAIPFKHGIANDGITHVIQQNNYTNICMQSISKQTSRIEEAVSKLGTSPLEKGESFSSKEDSVPFKPPPSFEKDKFHLNSKKDSEFVEELITKIVVTTLKGENSDEETLDKNVKVNRLSLKGHKVPKQYSKPYFPRPTSVDLQFEEKAEFAQFNGESIVEWNVMPFGLKNAPSKF